MKKSILFAIITICALAAPAQEVSSRAKAMRMMAFARPEYMVKDVKFFADTMTVYALDRQIVYPFGEWKNIEKFITEGQLKWTREIGYKQFFDTAHVSVNTLQRLDGSEIDVYRRTHTGLMEILAAHITDTAVSFTNGIHPGMTKDEVFNVFFKSYPRSYTNEVMVLKIVSGAREVEQIYTFKGRRLRHIQIRSHYKYY